MSRRNKAALACFLAVALGFALMGAAYLLAPRFMPYHAAVLGLGWDEVPLHYRRLLLAYQRGAGAASLACALAFALLVLGPFRRGERWARRAVPLVGLAGALPLAAVVLDLRLATGAPVPLVPALAAVGLLVAGWLLSAPGDGAGR